jgi:hypothetical protein
MQRRPKRHISKLRCIVFRQALDLSKTWILANCTPHLLDSWDGNRLHVTMEIQGKLNVPTGCCCAEMQPPLLFAQYVGVNHPQRGNQWQ